MVDLEKAFDSVWIDGLLLKMHYPGINGTIGRPQGSVLSPILFNIIVYDMCCNPVGKNFKYADDLTLLTYGHDSVLALNAMQDNITCLTK